MNKIKLLSLFFALIIISCTKNNSTTVVAPTTPSQIYLSKEEATIKNESGTNVIAVSFGEIQVQNIQIYKTIFITNTILADRYINVDSSNLDSSVFSISKIPTDSTCLNKKILKQYENCSIKVILDQSIVGTNTKFLKIGNISIAVYASVNPLPTITCNDGYHLSLDKTRCEADVINCPSNLMPEGASSATRQWDYNTMQYLPLNGCTIKDCNIQNYNSSLDANGNKICILKQYNINVIIPNANVGVAYDINSTDSSPTINCGILCDHNYDIRSTVKIKAVSNIGYNFDHWEGTSCNLFTADTCEIDFLSKDELIFPIFIEQPPTISSIKINDTLLDVNSTFYESTPQFNIKLFGNGIRSYAITEGGNCLNSNYVDYSSDGFMFTNNFLNQKKTFSIKVRNYSKESACLNFNITHDNIAPILTLTSPLENSFYGPNNLLHIIGTCEGSLPLNYSGDFSGQGLCVNGSFDLLVPFSQGQQDGFKVLNISETDLAGNTSLVKRIFQLDQTAPSLPLNPAFVNTNDSNTYNQYQIPAVSWGTSYDVTNVSYQMAIGTNLYGNDVVDWQTVTTGLTYQMTLIQALSQYTDYYVAVRAIDSNNNVSVPVAIPQSFRYISNWKNINTFQLLKPNAVKNNENFGNTFKFNSKYNDLFVRGKSAQGRDAIYVFTKNATTQKYEQKQIIEYPYSDSDNFGASFDTNNDLLYVSAPLEDSNSINYLDYNNATDTGVVYIYRKSNGTWNFEARVKSNTIGNSHQFGTLIQADDNGVYVMSIKDVVRGNTSTNVGTQGFVEYFKQSLGAWVVYEEYKILNSNIVGSGRNLIGFSVQKPYVLLYQSNGSNDPNTLYVIKHNTIDNSNILINSIQNITNATAISNSNSKCLNYSNYYHYNRGNKVKYNQGLFIFFDDVVSTGGGASDKCLFAYDPSLNTFQYSYENYTASSTYRTMLYDFSSNNYVKLFSKYDGSQYSYQLLVNTINPTLNTTFYADSPSFILANRFNVDKIYNNVSSAIYDTNNYPNNFESLYINDDEMFIGLPNNSSCDTTSITGTGCSNSGLIVIMHRI